MPIMGCWCDSTPCSCGASAGYASAPRPAEDAARLERAVRAVCGNLLNGYCAMVGGDVDGCKVGRGVSFDGTNCKARITALLLGQEGRIARATIEAMK